MGSCCCYVLFLEDCKKNTWQLTYFILKSNMKMKTTTPSAHEGAAVLYSELSTALQSLMTDFSVVWDNHGL